MQEPGLADLLREVVALREQVTQQHARLIELEGNSRATEAVEAIVPTSRRKLLRQLAGGLVTGVIIGAAGLAGAPSAQARLISNPAGGNNQVGMVVVPPGKPALTGSPTPTTPVYQYGLVASVTDGSNPVFSLSDLGTNVGVAYLLGNIGLLGNANGALSTGVRGNANGQNSFGIFSSSTGDSSVGVRIQTTGQSSKGFDATVSGDYSNGGYAYASGANTNGLTGDVSGDNSYGIFGQAIGSNSKGVYGSANGSYSKGVYGYANGQSSYAGYFSGDVYVGGTLSKSGGSFQIDHPLDPANQYLYHSFVESPDMLNIYNGLVTLDTQGTALISLPAWFEALNSDFRYGLTTIGEYAPVYIAEEVKGGQFKIAGGKAGQRVSWQLTGIRQDEWAKAHRIPVEKAKPDHEKGLYLHPELYGQSEEKMINQPPRPR